MPATEALATVGGYIDESRRLLQDEVIPYRYPDRDLVESLNIGLQEARRARADLFLPIFTIPYFEPPAVGANADAALKDKAVVFDPMYRSALIYYMVGRMQVRDDEQTTDARAGALLTKFISQLLTVAS